MINQDTIIWQKFFKGKVATSIYHQQLQYYHNNVSRWSDNSWAATLLKYLLVVLQYLWKEGNAFIHPKFEVGLGYSTYEKLRRKS